MTRRGHRVWCPARDCYTLAPESPSVSSPRMDRWTCPHCRREFNQRTNLRRHQRSACPELFPIRPYACDRGYGSRFYWPDMRERHQRHCSHVLTGQVQTEDSDVHEDFASDEGFGGSALPTEQSPPSFSTEGAPEATLPGGPKRTAVSPFVDNSFVLFCFSLFVSCVGATGEVAGWVAPPRSGSRSWGEAV